MPGDFDGCRFDFRIDSKKGLMPAKRKLRNADRRGALQGSGSGTGCSTLYSCRQCGLLLDTRQSLIQHKLSHRNITKPTASTIPDVTSSLTSTTEGDPCPAPTSWPTSGPTSSLASTSNENLTPAELLHCQNSPRLLQRSSMANERQSLIRRYITGLSRALPRHECDVIESRDASSRMTSSSKGRQLHQTVERLWMNKFKSVPPMEASNGCHSDAVTRCGDEEKTAQVKQADEMQQLFVRRVTAAPGTQPLFYTSLMRLQSAQRKEKRQTHRFLPTLKKSMALEDAMNVVQGHSLGGANINSQQKVSYDVNVNLIQQSAELASSADSAVLITPALNSIGGFCQQQFVCDFDGCKRTFRELKHLKVHRMQHTNERPLACSVCNYSCRQRNSLNWHMKSRHGLNKHVTSDGRTVYG